MYCRFLAQLTLAATAFALAGCAMVDHSNTMLFGTNTNVGLQVGTDASNVPSINVGYRRQEAVFLPLQSNLKDSNGKFMPCPGTAANEKAVELANNCKFLAKNGESKAEDSYSVLASFGATFSAGNDGKEAKASGGLAQYFATGAAAQILALKGGAAVVAVSAAAEKSAEGHSDSALVALVGGKNALKSGKEIQATRAQQRTRLADHLQSMADDAAYNTEADKLSVAAGHSATHLRTSVCPKMTRAECIALIRTDQFDDYIDEYYTAYKPS